MYHVVYVDDEPDLLLLAKAFLEENGEFIVDTFKSAEEMLKSETNSIIDVIISDYQMPGTNGIEFLKKIRALFGDIPFILFTGRGREEIVIEAINNGADFYLQKGGDPVSQFAELAHKVRKAAERKKGLTRLSRINETLLQLGSDYLKNISELTRLCGELLNGDCSMYNRVSEGCIVTRGAWNIPVELNSPDTQEGLICFDVINKEGKEAIVRKNLGTSEYAVTDPIVNVYGMETYIGHHVSYCNKIHGSLCVFYRHDVEPTIEDLRIIGILSTAIAQEEEREYTKEVRESLIRQTAGVNGREFFERTIQWLVDFTAADIGIISECIDENIAESLAMVVDGRLVENFRYSISGTPFEDLPEKGFCYYPDKVAQLFPESHELLKLDINGYAGIPMRNKSGGTLGMFCVLSHGKLIISKYINTVLELLSIRACSELERWRFEQQLEENEALFKEIFNNSSDPIFIHEIKKDNYPGHYLMVNSSAADKLGYSKDELLQMSPFDLIPAEEKKNIDLEQISKESKDNHASFETVHARKDGSTYPIEVITHHFPLKGKKVALTLTRDISSRKWMENSLRITEQKYSVLFDNMLEGFAYCRMFYDENNKPSDFVFLKVNPAFSRISDTYNVISKRATEVFPGIRENYPALFKVFGRVASTGKSETLDISFTRNPTWLHISVYSQVKNHFVAVFEDITKRKLAEQALIESERKYREIFENSAIGLSIVGLDGRLIGANGYLARMLGYESSEHFLNSVSDVGLQLYQDIKQRREILDILQQKGFYEDAIVPTFHRDGHIVWCSVNIKVIKDSEGNVVYHLGAIKDITEQVTAENRLKESENKYRMLAENLRDGIFQMSLPSGKYEYMSPAFLSLTGYSPEDFYDTPLLIQSIIHPEYIDYFEQNWFRLLHGDVPQYYEFQIITKSGEVRWMNQRNTLIKDADGRSGMLQGIVTDITRRKRIEEALKLANHKLNLLGGITRHDILNHIVGISGYIELTKEIPVTPEIKYYLEKIEISLEKIKKEIQFTKLYQGLGTKEPQWQKVDAIISNLHFPQTIQISMDLHDLEIFADPLVLKVWYNLLDNSIRHGEHVTWIRVTANENFHKLLLLWEDNGCGVPVGEKELIFDQGYGKNSGLGLFLVREILAISSMTIKETGTEGMGARFEITVPAGFWRRIGS